jgi:hypothetical protein
MRKTEEEGRYKIGRNVLMHSIVICLTAVIISSLAIPGLLAEETGAAVEVRVTPESEYVEEGATFSVTIDVDDVTNFKCGNFYLSFDSKVLKYKDVEEGSLDGETILIKIKKLDDDDTVYVNVGMPMGETANGSGHLAEVSFKVKGAEGDTSVLDLSEGSLVDKSSTKIPAEWKGAEIKIGSKEEEEEEEEEEVSEEVTPGSPKITVSKPAEAVIGNVVRELRTFNISVNQIADINWQKNGSVVQTNESVTQAVYTNTSAVIGSWNVSAIATNRTTGLSDTHSWIWHVTLTLTATPAPTLAPRVTPAPTRAPGVTPTPKPAAITRTTAKPKSTPTPTPKPAGFEVIFAIAMLAIAYVLLREK